MRALTALLTLAAITTASCEPFLADLPDLLPPTDGPDASDTAPPTVFFAAPDDGADVAGTVTLEISAVDAEGPVRTVALLVDDTAERTRDTPPFNFDVDTTALTDGPHAFKAIATDAAGNTAEAILSAVVTNVVPRLRIEAPLATRSDSDFDIIVTSQVPLRALELRVGDTVVESVGDEARLVFTATTSVPPTATPATLVTATGTDDQAQQGSVDVTLLVDDTARIVTAEVQPTTATHVASPFDVSVVVEPDEAAADGAPLVSCAVCAGSGVCGDDDFVDVDVIDGACGARTGITCSDGDEVVVVARAIDAAGNIGTSTLTRTCSVAPASAPIIVAIDSTPDATTTVQWTAPIAGPGDAGVDHFVLSTVIDGGLPTSVPVVGSESQTLTLPACVVVDVEVTAVDVFGRSSPPGTRRGLTHCGHNGVFTPITLELDVDGSANLSEMSSARSLATVATLDVGDIDRDGDLDIVVFGERNSGNRRVLRLKQGAPAGGQPRFVATDLLDPATNGNARQLALADVTADGLLDIVAMTPQTTALLAATGGGNFAAPTLFALSRTSAVVGPVTRGNALPDILLSGSDAIVSGGRGVLTSTPCAADGTLLGLVDVDGLPGAELIVYNSTTDVLRLRRRDGADPGCPFSAVSTDAYTHTQTNLVTTVVLDIDGNGRPDLARLGTREVVIDRDAAFFAAGTTATNTVLTPRDIVDAAAIDLDSDGDDDLVLIDDRTPGNVRFVVVEQGTLTLGDVVPLSGTLQEVQVADVDGDGIDDVVVAAENPSAVHILKGGGVRRRGNGGAQLFHQLHVDGAVGATPFDVDRDGALEVVSAGSSGIFAIDVDIAGALTAPLGTSGSATAFVPGVVDGARGTSVLFGTTAGDWKLLNEAGATETIAAAFAPARALAAIDLDDDGDLDSLGVFPQLAVRLNEGGSFGAGLVAPTTTTNAVALAVADIDLDGLLEVVIAGDTLDVVGVQPTLALEGSLDCADGPATDVAIVDVDRDGRADVLAACAGPVPTLLVARNTGNSPATFAVSEVAVGGDGIGPLAAGDLDGDGDADVMLGVQETSAGALRVLRNEGGSYAVDDDVFVAPDRAFRDLQLVDLEGDGPLDMIVTLDDGTIAILHGTASAP